MPLNLLDKFLSADPLVLDLILIVNFNNFNGRSKSQINTLCILFYQRIYLHDVLIVVDMQS